VGLFSSRLLPGRVPLKWKKWFSSVLLIATGSEASGWVGNLVVFLGATSGLAIQMLFGEVLVRKSAHYEALAFLMALK